MTKRPAPPVWERRGVTASVALMDEASRTSLLAVAIACGLDYDRSSLLVDEVATAAEGAPVGDLARRVYEEALGRAEFGV